MNVYNSNAGLNQDDTDMTMINHSFLYGGNDESITSCIPIVRRLQQANQPKPIINPSNSDDIHDNHNSFKSIHPIEEILNFYRRDLKQESNTQVDCNQQLITRLIDFLRPIYSSDENHMKDLDVLYKEIFDLQEIRYTEQKDKNDQLYNQVRYLKQSIITPTIENDDRESLMTNIYRMNTMIDYEQWTEMEEETKQLHDLVKTQREQIDQLIELLSPTEIIIEEKHNPFQELPSDTTKKCTVCDYEFPIIFSEIQITNHVEECLSTSKIVATNLSLNAERLECPYCKEKLPNIDDMGYIQHLSQCYNELTGNF